ncbi:uncharacterized protein AKAW2_80805S [Aspergillus luchuensis]|uniref:Similar to An11g09480 n=1 Tax=Aspergillus kawachii TaxID=1069201 RepID=A0A146FQK0_ASPKA|nr:uncharacterized protein AKAW2_80805S [Aspergillus luchuensis]BCS05004.1 hypothetical protein AKAW2_80805S [Aspergillus luchuensis]BCS16563.1 hypothetical protein ALUC_80770S [Aspergillus luchuensis]GAA85794.1 similar to An11g09480 [Aspergillus luchuensis IFO 4308]GAT28184.1 similar to An11g09480 [Aspergillus luchuensis]
MPTSILPPIPYLIYGIFEPISLIGGSLYPHLDASSFILSQIPDNPDTTGTITPSSLSLAYQLSNIYFLLALLGVALIHSTSEPKVLRNYLVCLAVADLTHILAAGWSMGWERFVDVAEWNALTWGNVGVTAALFGSRMVVLGGGFGGVGGGEKVKRKGQ